MRPCQLGRALTEAAGQLGRVPAGGDFYWGCVSWDVPLLRQLIGQDVSKPEALASLGKIPESPSVVKASAGDPALSWAPQTSGAWTKVGRRP